MPIISIELGKPVEVSHTDSLIKVAGLGTLKISKGSIEWLPKGNHVNHRSMKWDAFADLMEAEGKLVKKRKVPSKKAVSAPAAKSVGPKTKATATEAGIVIKADKAKLHRESERVLKALRPR